MASKGINVYGYSASPETMVRYDVEEKPLHRMYCENNGESIMSKVHHYHFEADLGWFGSSGKDFHIQAFNGNESHQLLERMVRIGEYGIPDFNANLTNIHHQKMEKVGNQIINYGFISGVGDGQAHKGYCYTGPSEENWMSEIQSIKVRDLVLPGAHDAGMNGINISGGTKQNIIDEINNIFSSVNKYIDSKWFLRILPFSKLPRVNDINLTDPLIYNIIANLAVTQKDSFKNMLTTGTRYFDFRPAYDKSNPNDPARHIHGFVRGSAFEDFLKDTHEFLSSHKKEVVFVTVQSNGIKNQYFDFMTKGQVKETADTIFSNNTGDIRYDIVNSMKDIENQTLGNIVKSKKRVIILHEPGNINDSYVEKKYGSSIHSADAVNQLIKDTLNGSTDGQFTLLQLQANGAKYISDNVQNSIWQWINICKTNNANIMHYTKPIFDQKNYNYLRGATRSFKAAKNLIVLQNDFVDIALTHHAKRLSVARMNG